MELPLTEPVKAHFRFSRRPSDLPAVVRYARHQATETARRWLPYRPDLIADLALITSELVTNATHHAELIAMDLALTPAPEPSSRVVACLYITVYDSSPHQPPLPHRPADTADSGRGLLLVHHLAVAHGTDVSPGHKAVWAQLDVPH